mmetsp:Transcript_8623/g.18683  ORF Transcript_8623/g.18683 Transcript_8623/m.18683 type:complete len:358 (+) Transcript_8623:219-1292(+)
MVLTSDSNHSTVDATGTEPAMLKERFLPAGSLSLTAGGSHHSISNNNGSRPLRRVTFDEDANEYYDPRFQILIPPAPAAHAAMDPEDDLIFDANEVSSTTVWYTSAEYQHFRAQVRDKIGACHLEQRNPQHAHRQFYIAIRNLYLTARKVDFLLQDATSLLTPDQLAQLGQIYQGAAVVPAADEEEERDENAMEVDDPPDHNSHNACSLNNSIHSTHSMMHHHQQQQQQEDSASSSSVPSCISPSTTTTTTVDTVNVEDEDIDSHTTLDLIGMEYHIIASIKKDLRGQRDALQDVVFDVQREFRDGLLPNLPAMQDELQASCLNFTQSNGLFAQLLALAQRQEECVMTTRAEEEEVK